MYKDLTLFPLPKQNLPQKFRVLFDSSFGQICQNQQRPRKTRAASAGKCAMLIQVSAFKLRQKRKHLRQYVLLQIKFYSLTQTYFFAIAMSVSGMQFYSTIRSLRDGIPN